ncbi:hypothetical protein Rhopal_002783-T1 [Rhodotorula paludigena]|uniref:Rsm22-domain-containing protein n=1 Tax=Rhodotorula paludigena TaxID=86838 RepID=A0AAV5GKN3_9BASI|nr:hypothetical protein Rhopal_002783-T1 [Rhodotorula paludigena]
MLPRAVRPTVHKQARTASSAAIDRFSLDIYAGHRAEQERANESGAVSKSPAARRGESLRGDVQLPRELKLATDAIVESIDDKTLIRQNALDLYARLKRTSGLAPPSSGKPTTSNSYDAVSSLAYLAGLMPSVYAATLHVLDATKQRLQLLATDEDGQAGAPWSPDRLVDYGSGTGSAAWAFEDVWGVETADGVAREYVGLDPARSMVELSSGLFGALPLRRTDDGVLSGAASSARLDAKAYQLALPASASSLAKLQLSRKSSERKRTIALAAFSLGELPTREKRKDLVRAMWDSGAELMIVIDRGTPAGSRLVIEAREQLLMYGRREVTRAKGSVDVELDQELLDAGFEAVPEVNEDAEVDPSLGSFVMAPCPHDGGCPLHHSTKSFCHFGQRVKTPAFLRNTKHSSRGEEDSKFSYVVVRRGQRPTSAAPARPSAVEGLLAEVDALEAQAAPDAAVRAIASVIPTAAQQDTIDVPSELSWPRLVAPPKKRSGHIIMEVCASSGDIERHTIPKSQGRQAYYDARKVSWGDTFPHAPKNGPQPSPSTTPSAFDSPDLAPRSKFGGDARHRGKKADREMGKREARSLREAERHARREKRMSAKRRAGGSGDGGFGGAADEHGVMDVEVDFDSDGKMRISR